jgi:diadenylate cyclase
LNAIIRYIVNIGPSERLIVLAELLLIGVFVYIVISFLEGTRGERLFRGVIFVLLVGSLILNLVVRQFGMARIAYLYSGFLIAVLIVAVTAFQPELRRALIRIGQADLFSPSSPQQLTRCVEEIVEAVTQMAAEKTGAIIVISQQVPLGEFAETGVRIDAKVTSEMLKTIFYEGTPLHDMAVLIQGDRIVAARVQLPLAEADSTIHGRLGSRHRAAIGISTASDALVIVVSEETGIVSLAMNGQLLRNISEAQLRRHLNTALVKATPLLERLGHGKQNEQDTIHSDEQTPPTV